MAVHEFAMMPLEPQKGVRFDMYEPQKYACIAVPDDAIEGILPKLAEIEFYHHVVDEPKKGLAYYGITLIPPTSERSFIEAIGNSAELDKLRTLLETAVMFDKWVIHFGI